MKFSKFSIKQFENLNESEINTILSLTNRCYSVKNFVNVKDYDYLKRHSGKVCTLDDGSYLNILYSSLSINTEDVEFLINKTKKVWDILNKEAIDNNEETVFVNTLVITGLPFEDGEDVLYSGDDYSVSRISTYELTAIKEFRPIDKKMYETSENISNDEFVQHSICGKDKKEINALLNLFGADLSIEEIVEIDFDDPSIECDSIVGKMADGSYLSICITFDEPNQEVIKNVAKNTHNISLHLNKDNEGEPIKVETVLIDMGANLRNKS